MGKLFRKGIMLTLGSVLFAFGIEAFLVPNQIIDGGIVGISIMISHLFDIKLGILLVVLNMPFLFIGYKQIGKTFAISTLYSIVLASVMTTLFHHVKPVTTDPMLASVFGGILLGIGVGVVIRTGGSLDGTEITAILINKKIPFSVGEIVMGFNVFILGSAGLVFGWNQAMYSLIAYFVAYKVIDITMEGLDEMKEVWIISDQSEELKDAIFHRLGRNVTYLKGEGGYTGDEKKILVCYISRLEEAKLKTIIDEKDEDALIKISHVSELKGGQFKKKDIH